MKLRFFLVAGATCVSLSALAWDQQGNPRKQSSEQSQNSSQMSEQSQSSLLSHTQDQVVREAQQRLASQGYDPGAADGKLGPKTEAQIRKFQQEHRLEPSGQLDDKTLAALGVSQNSSTGSSSTGSFSESSSSSH